MPIESGSGKSERSRRHAWFRSFARDTRAATAIEYGLIVACIFLVIVVSVTLVGDDVSDNFNSVANTMDEASN